MRGCDSGHDTADIAAELQIPDTRWGDTCARVSQVSHVSRVSHVCCADCGEECEGGAAAAAATPPPDYSSPEPEPEQPDIETGDTSRTRVNNTVCVFDRLCWTDKSIRKVHWRVWTSFRKWILFSSTAISELLHRSSNTRIYRCVIIMSSVVSLYYLVLV